MRQTVNRNDLYERVWATPMRTLAAEFGISDRGLTKVCAKLNVPTPPLGYWAKKAAGKKVHQPPLPDLKPGELQSAVINPPTKKPPAETASAEEVETVAESLSDLVLPEFPNELHRLVKQWVTNHKQEQARERREYSRPFLIGLRRIDLTERDIYRFRVTSALLTALEAQGIKIKEADVRGAIAVITDGEPLEMAIKERLQRLRPPGFETGKKWSAFGERYPSSMYPAGALRLIINTSYGGRWERRWEETDGRDFLKLIPTIVAEIIHAGPILRQERLEHEERRAREAEERARAADQARLQRIDDERWGRFREVAADWHEAERLRIFISRIESLSAENDTEYEGRSAAEWLKWAQRRVEELDPTNRDLWFEVVGPPQPSWW